MSTATTPSDVNMAAATTDPLLLQLLAEKGVYAAVLRLDQIHPVISGNKWFKLRYHLSAALEQDCHSIITFGGAYSNHIVALAFAARQLGLPSTGIIRGERPPLLSHTLQTAAGYGMHLIFVDRKTYSEKERSSIVKEWIASHPHSYLVPEGGSGPQGIRGCREILSLTDQTVYTHIMCCIGTGTMFRGLADTLLSYQQLIGVPVLKLSAGDPLLQEIEQHCGTLPVHCKIVTGYEMGGYARKDERLIGFMKEFFSATLIPTDFVYTAKLVRAFIDLTEKNYFAPGSRVLLIHSGGLQGNGSLPAGTLPY